MMHQPPNQLMDLLSQPQISVPQLFEKPDILSKIKTKLQLFVDFLLRNSQFTKQMIGLGIKAPMHKNQNMKKVAYVASDILTCDHDVIADIFVQSSKQRIRLYSQDQEFICEEIVTDGETGELVIAQKKQSGDEEPTDSFTRKYVYLLDMLDYLNQKERDENCVNYLSKVLNTVIRVKPIEAFQFFREKQEILDLIIKEAGEHPSLGLTLVKLVHELEDKEYRDEKTLIVRKIIGRIKQNIQNCEATASFMEFVEEIFNKNKYRGQQVDEIKIVTQPLVDKDVVDWMIHTLCEAYKENKTNIVANCTLYLLKLIERMNVDDEQDPYSYSQVENQKPTMDFQVQSIFSNFQKLVQMTSQITRDRYVKTAVLDYLDLLVGIMKNKIFSAQIKFDRIKCLQTLLKVYLQENRKGNGIIKNRIVWLLEKILNAPSDQKIIPTPSITEMESKALRIQTTSENKCFNQKLSVVFLHPDSSIDANLREIYEKYKGILGPLDFIQKRQRNIEQLKFAHHNPYLQTQSEIKEQEKPPSMILGELEISYDGEGFTKPSAEEKSPNVGVKKNGNINLDMLNLKVQQAKIKRSKSRQPVEGVKKEECVQDKKKKSNEDGDGTEVKCGPLKKEQVDYFTKHLILF